MKLLQTQSLLISLVLKASHATTREQHPSFSSPISYPANAPAVEYNTIRSRRISEHAYVVNEIEKRVEQNGDEITFVKTHMGSEEDDNEWIKNEIQAIVQNEKEGRIEEEEYMFIKTEVGTSGGGENHAKKGPHHHRHHAKKIVKQENDAGKEEEGTTEEGSHKDDSKHKHHHHHHKIQNESTVEGSHTDDSTNGHHHHHHHHPTQNLAQKKGDKEEIVSDKIKKGRGMEKGDKTIDNTAQHGHEKEHHSHGKEHHSHEKDHHSHGKEHPKVKDARKETTDKDVKNPVKEEGSKKNDDDKKDDKEIDHELKHDHKNKTDQAKGKDGKEIGHELKHDGGGQDHKGKADQAKGKEGHNEMNNEATNGDGKGGDEGIDAEMTKVGGHHNFILSPPPDMDSDKEDEGEAIGARTNEAGVEMDGDEWMYVKAAKRVTDKMVSEEVVDKANKHNRKGGDKTNKGGKEENKKEIDDKKKNNHGKEGGDKSIKGGKEENKKEIDDKKKNNHGKEGGDKSIKGGKEENKKEIDDKKKNNHGKEDDNKFFGKDKQIGQAFDKGENFNVKDKIVNRSKEGGGQEGHTIRYGIRGTDEKDFDDEMEEDVRNLMTTTNLRRRGGSRIERI